MGELKRIDFDKKEFVANGKTYYLQLDGLSVGRFRHYERFVQFATFGTDFMSMFETLKQIFQAATSGVDVLKALKDIGDLSYNQMAVIKDRNEQQYSGILMMCTLFINRADENIADWDERIANEKIQDWVQEGINVQDFFLLATSQIDGYRGAYLTPWLKAVAEKREKEVTANKS